MARLMDKLAGVKTSTRVALVFAVFIVLLVALVAVSVMRMRELAADIDAIAISRVPKIVLSGRAAETLLQSSRQMRNTLILDDETEIRSELADITRNQQQVQEFLEQVGKLVATEAEKNFYAAIVATGAAYDPLRREFIALGEKGNYSAAKDLMVEKVRQAEAKYLEAISGFIEFQASASEAETQAARQSQERARLTILMLVGLTLGASILTLLAAALIVRSLRARLGESSYAALTAKAIAAGDLTREVVPRAGDDEAILRAMKRMRDDLAGTVGEIRRSADSVGTAAGQLAAGGAELSVRTEQQASSLEETAASMEEITSAVTQNSDNARQADALALNAAQRAVKGGEEVGKVVVTMTDISRSAKRIAEIIGVIDGIAFQTNILALNAAVEAARAGDQGRGFAVVASEVRSLAQRSAQAAKEIKGLIGESLDQVANGSRAVEQAGATIDSLVVDVKQVSDLMRSIAEASAEQSRGVQQVNKTITEMDKTVQQNASSVQESVSAAEAMRLQADRLVTAVGAFRLAADGVEEAARTVHAAPPPRAPSPRPAPILPSRPSGQRTALPAASATGEWEEF